MGGWSAKTTPTTGGGNTGRSTHLIATAAALDEHGTHVIPARLFGRAHTNKIFPLVRLCVAKHQMLFVFLLLRDETNSTSTRRQIATVHSNGLAVLLTHVAGWCRQARPATDPGTEQEEKDCSSSGFVISVLPEETQLYSYW